MYPPEFDASLQLNFMNSIRYESFPNNNQMTSS